MNKKQTHSSTLLTVFRIPHKRAGGPLRSPERIAHYKNQYYERDYESENVATTHLYEGRIIPYSNQFYLSEGRMYSGGDIASSVVQKIINQNRKQAIAIALENLRAAPSCSSTSSGGRATCVRESTRTERLVTQGIQATIDAAQVPRGMTSSLLTQIRETNTLAALKSDPTQRFVQYQGPRIPAQCPRPTAEQLNATLPKPSSKCNAQIPFYLRPSG